MYTFLTTHVPQTLCPIVPQSRTGQGEKIKDAGSLASLQLYLASKIYCFKPCTYATIHLKETSLDLGPFGLWEFAVVLCGPELVLLVAPFLPWLRVGLLVPAHIGISESQPGSVPDRSKSSKTDNNHKGDQLQQDTKNGVGSVTVVMAS